MKNSYWYILIAILSLIPFIYTVWSKKSKQIWTLYLVMAGLSYAFEFVILVLFRSYVYYPHILRQPYFDNIMGAIFSDAFTVPMISVFIAAHSFPMVWNLLVFLSILGIELLFLHLGIYKHFWWHIWYTAIGLATAFLIAKKWLYFLQYSLSRYVHYFTLSIVSFVIHSSIVFVLCSFFRTYLYTVNWFPANPIRGHIAFATVYVLLLSLLFAAFVYLKASWILRLGILAMVSGMDLLLINHHLLILNSWWSISYFFAIRLLLLLFLDWFDIVCIKPKKSFNSAN